MTTYTHNIQSLQGGRKENQDSAAAMDTKSGFLMVVCDGMGGAKGGKTASTMAVETILNEVANSEQKAPERILTDAIKKANAAIYSCGQSNPELQGMGTTVVAILIDKERATVAHVGDSRVYQIRGKSRVFRTFDHSMVFELVRRGRISEEQARLSAESNVILRALGTKPDVDVEINRNLPYIKGDRFLLCSDGICGAVTDSEVCRLIRVDKSVEKTVEIITQRIDDIGFNNGGRHDNLTAALIELHSNSTIKVKMNKQSKIMIAAIAALLAVSMVGNICFYWRQGSEKVKLSTVDSMFKKINISIDTSRVEEKQKIELKKQVDDLRTLLIKK